MITEPAVVETSPDSAGNVVDGSVPVTSVDKSIAPHDGAPAALPCNTVVVAPWLAKSVLANTAVTAPTRPNTDVTSVVKPSIASHVVPLNTIMSPTVQILCPSIVVEPAVLTL